jgi:peptidoglycan/xylan/chitin deacetylase (PgdA/CDA1 family)
MEKGPLKMRCAVFLPVALFALLLSVVPPTGAAPVPSPSLITHGPRSRPEVALTFDVCQKPSKPAGFDRAVVGILERYQAPATFFLGGDWIRTHPAEARQLAEQPLFALGNHSWSHPDLRELDDAGIRAEAEKTQKLLLELTGRPNRLFRLPFGTWSTQVMDTLAGEGLYVIQWDVVSGDPDPRTTAEAILAEVKRHARNGSIIIMHANGRGRHTAEALPEVIEYLRGKGFTLVTVPQLLGLSSASPKNP